jgi:NAD(P)-dependent dehydrogenase (short-subunit alcohol dehydrogenase family)
MSAIPVTPSIRLDGRRALVTGAGRGIGLACAAALAAAGADVSLVARSAEEVAEAAAGIRQAGGRAECFVVDVTDIVVTAGWVSQQEPFDILVNNAGMNRPGPFLKIVSDDFDAVFSLNVRAAFFVTQAVAGRLVAEGRPGSIIMMSSQMGHVGAAGRTVYCGTKHAIEGMTKAIAAELGPHGIRVNSICPTFVETPMTKPFFEDEKFRASVLSKIKLGRIGHVEDIMGAVVFLASDASALMTGSALMLDGGWTSTS